MEISWVTVVGLVGTVSSIAFGYIGYQRGLKKESYQRGGQDGGLRADIEYIKRRTDDTLIEQKETNKSLSKLSERVTRVEESSKQAHKRIDGIQNSLRNRVP
ncbi:MAG: hypothetical protein QM401_04985 [Bacillota bacterium]|nr:hypothetical protein [Bacillota bacterium]